MFKIRLGVPEMENFWTDLCERAKNSTLSKNEEALYKKVGKAMTLISANPRYPGLHTHDIDALSSRYGMKVWQSYLENHKSDAGRIFWVYGPDKNDITIIGIEPHPNDKKDAYDKITLSKT